MVVDLGVSGNSSGPLHDPDGFIEIADHDVLGLGIRRESAAGDLLVTKFHFRPLTPDFREVLDSPEIYLGTLFQDFASAVQIWFCFP